LIKRCSGTAASDQNGIMEMRIALLPQITKNMKGIKQWFSDIVPLSRDSDSCKRKSVKWALKMSQLLPGDSRCLAMCEALGSGSRTTLKKKKSQKIELVKAI
jgi:hypothetical protein